MANNPYENYSYNDLMKLIGETEEEEMRGSITHEDALNRYMLIDAARVKNGNKKQSEKALKEMKENKANHEKFAEESSLKSTTYRVGGYPQSMVDEEKANAARSKNIASQYDTVIKAAEQKKDEKKPLTSSYMSFSYSDLSNNRKRIEEQQVSGDITSEAAQREYDNIDIARAYNGNASELKDFIKQAEASKKNWEEISKINVTPLEGAKKSPEKKKADERVQFYSDLIAIATSNIDKIEKDEAATSANEYYGNIAQERGGSSDYVPSEWVHSDYDNINRFADAGTRGGVWGMLSSEELSTLNSLYNMDRDNPVLFQKYFDELKPVLEYRLANKESEEAREFGEAHPYIAGVESVARNVFGAVPAAVDNVVEGVFGNGVNTYDATSRYLRKSQSYRQGGSQYMNDNYGEGATWAYNTGLSLVENVANVALFKGAGSAASALISVNMASNAAAQQMINIADRGGNDTQILVGGVASGITEYFFEKVSFDRLLDPSAAKNLVGVLKNGLAQSGVEMSEELFTEASNIFLDAVIMQNNSENAIKRRRYVMDGDTAEEATKKVFMETLDQVLQAAASGFVSGGIMGTGSSFIQSASRNNYMTEVGERVMQNPTVMNRLIELGEKSGNNEANSIAETIKEGFDVTPKQVGKMIDSVIGQSITNDGGLMNIMNTIRTLEGRTTAKANEGYDLERASKIEFDTAKAVMHFAQGTATDADNALLSHSPGAMTLLTAVEGNNKAINSIKTAAGTQLRESVPSEVLHGVQNDNVTDTKFKVSEGAKISDADVYSHGKKISIPENAKMSNGIIISEESENFRKSNPEGYKMSQTLAEDLNLPVVYVDDLVDAKGQTLNGIKTSKGIFINTNAKDVSRLVVTHEFSHRMKDIAPKAWAKYQEYVIEREKANGRYYAAYKLKKYAYDENKFTGEQLTSVIDEEIAADYIGDMFEDQKELQAFIEANRSEAVTIRDIYYGILDKLGLLDEKKKAQLMWRRAYREAMQNKDKKSEGGSKRSAEGTRRDSENYYTEKEYKNFGWARANGILNEGQNADYRSKFAMAVKGLAKFPKTKKGEFIIPVSDIYDKDSEGINNVLVFAKGRIDNPIITGIIEIYEYDETELDKVRRNIYELERRGIQQKAGGVIGRHNADSVGIKHYGEYIESRKNNNDYDFRRGDSAKLNEGSKRTKKSVAGTRLSEIDTEYLELAKNPEKNEARLRELVDKAAKRAGYDSPILYHGGNHFFTIFGKGNKTSQAPEGAHFFTDNKDVAYSYTGYKKNVDLNKSNHPIYKQAGPNGEVSENRSSSGGVYPSYLKIQNPYIVDFEGKTWLNKVEGMDINESAIWAKENGYDGVIAKNIVDPGDLGDANYEMGLTRKPSTDYIVFSPNQIKSADLVTYDDDGNIIPLSERFNTKNNDIRYSISGTRLSEYEGGELERLTKENAELRAQFDTMNRFNLSESMRNTAEIRKAAQDLKEGYGSKMSVSDIQSELTELYNYMVGKDTKSDEGVRNRIHSLAQKVINQATETVTNEQYGELLDRIKEVKIRVPESERADFADGYEYFRKHNMGKITLANEGLDLDVLWNELTNEYGELIEEDVTGSQERLERIIEIRDEISPTEESIYKTREEYDSAVLSLENDIYDSFYNIPKSEGGNKFIFYGKRAPMKTTAEETSKERARAKKIGWNKSELKKKIDSDYNYISKMLREPTDQRHIPEDMRGSVAFLLEQFNFETAQIDRLRAEGKEADSPTAVRLSKMYDAYADIMRKAWGIDKGAEKSELMDNYLSEDLQALRDEIPLDESGEHKRIQDMSVEELRSVAKVLASIHHVITTRNKAFNSAVKEEISELGQSSVQDLENIRRMRRGSGERLDYNGAVKLFDSYFNIDTVQPWDFFHQMGDTLERLYMEERKAFNSHIENIREAQGVLTEATKYVDLEKITGKHADEFWIDLQSGEKIKLTKGQILSLYALYQRNQGKEHILGGGIVTNNESKNSAGQKTSANKAHAVTQADMGKMFEEISTEEKEMVKKVVNFLSKRCAEWGNETSMRLYGYEKYGEGWYFPIKVSKQALNTYYGEKGEGTLRSQGFTKSTVKKAQNAIDVSDFFDTVTSHINGMSLYNTIALPMLDLERVLNYSQSSVSDKVRQEIVKTFGKSSEKYIEVFHKDVNGSRKTDDKDMLERLAGTAKKASIGLNARVLLQQPTSIARVFMFMNPIDIPAVWDAKKEIAEIQKNVPIAYWKSLGFRDIGTGSSMKQVLLDNEGWYDKVSMGGYGLADDITWGLIYKMIKNEVKRTNPGIDVNSEEFMNKVRDRMDYIVDRTQVVDSVFHRTQAMRSGNLYTKNATMFMSEPLKTYNLYRTEVLDVMKGKNPKTKLARATAVFVVSNALLALVQAIPDTWREDDDEDLFNEEGKPIPLLERYLKNVLENMIDNVNPFTYMPYIKDVWSIIQGYSMDRIEYSGLSNLVSASKGLLNEQKTITSRLFKFGNNAAALFGFSPGNLVRDVKGLGTTVYGLIGDEYADYLMTKWDWDVKNPKNKSKFMKHYERAVSNGHAEDAAMILEDYLSATFKGEDFDNSKAEKVIEEMSKLYDKADKGDKKKLLYRIPDDNYNLDGKGMKINEEDYPEYVSGAYKKLFDLAYEFVTSKEYKNISEEDKIRSFGELKTYSEEAQKADDIKGYKLSGWKNEVYKGDTSFADSVVTRAKEREYKEAEDKYLESIGYEEPEDSESSSKRHVKVYDKYLKDKMDLDEYAEVRMTAKKKASQLDGKEAMSKDELQIYLDYTDYPYAVKAALFEAIGNKGWYNPYTGQKIQ